MSETDKSCTLLTVLSHPFLSSHLFQRCLQGLEWLAGFSKMLNMTLPDIAVAEDCLYLNVYTPDTKAKLPVSKQSLPYEYCLMLPANVQPEAAQDGRQLLLRPAGQRTETATHSIMGLLLSPFNCPCSTRTCTQASCTFLSTAGRHGVKKTISSNSLPSVCS